MLTPPMRARFGIVERLNYYPVEELEQIVVRSAHVLAVEIEDGTLEVQRMASRRVERVRFTPAPMPHEDAAEGGDRR